MPGPPFHLDLSRFEAAILDLDGTLVDTLGDFVAALNGMLDDLSLPRVTPSEVSTRVGKGSEHLIREVLAHVTAPVGDEFNEEAFSRYQHHYEQINGRHSALYDGVSDGLAGLKASGLRLACLTNKPCAFARSLLEAKGLIAVFDVVFGGDDFARKKPDPLPLLRTCEALGTAPARTLMIGDSSNDALAARAAGCPVLLVTYGYNHGEPVKGVDADGFVDSIRELTHPYPPDGVRAR